MHGRLGRSGSLFFSLVTFLTCQPDYKSKPFRINTMPLSGVPDYKFKAFTAKSHFLAPSRVLWETSLIPYHSVSSDCGKEALFSGSRVISPTSILAPGV